MSLEKFGNAFSDVGMSINKAMRGIEETNPELIGIFGDTVWTNKDRLPDRMLRSLIEHFSSVTLNSESVTVDQMSTAYEYLVRVFANDGGQTAKEFYTNRTVVDLMVRLLKPTMNSTIYDPTCGTGGMLLNCVNRVESDSGMGKTLKLFGQELNVTTSAIARMNLYIHAVNNFSVHRNDTLSNPGFIEDDKLKQFDIVLANPHIQSVIGIEYHGKPTSMDETRLEDCSSGVRRLCFYSTYSCKYEFKRESCYFIATWFTDSR